MNALPTDNIAVAGKRRPGEHAGSRLVIPGLVFFLAGAALSAVWFTRGSWHHSDAESPAAVALSDATKAVLQHLDTPVEIRYYSMLDASSVPESVQAFAGRVDQLLAQYEQAAGDRVKVIRSNSSSSANAAQADGITAFNNEKGDACFLGIAVVCGSQKESLPQLAPEWEQAVEPDLTRAIARAIARAVQFRPGTQPPAPADTASLDAVKKAFPNLDAVSLESGTQILRAAAMAQFQQAAEEMQARVKDAEQRFIQTQGDQSEAAQQAAAEELRKIQAEGSRKLQQIAQDSHAQIAALQQLKKAAP
jgi:hypothetical protein